MTKAPHDEFRFERKFLVHKFSIKELEQIIKFNSACFKELYHPRYINNIYFDTPGFNNYYDNIEGETERWKARIRWYGDLFGNIHSPKLEFKIKKGLMGTKHIYSLADFEFDNRFNKTTIKQLLINSNLPKNVSDLMSSLKPTLLNKYRRKYFVSANKKFRLTMDDEMSFYSISTIANTYLNQVKDTNAVVIELKYSTPDDTQADQISNEFPFRLTKNSKYLQGLEKVLLN